MRYLPVVYVVYAGCLISIYNVPCKSGKSPDKRVITYIVNKI